MLPYTDSRGGLGETYDLLIIDEAQEYTADQEGAIKHVITASPKSVESLRSSWA